MRPWSISRAINSSKRNVFFERFMASALSEGSTKSRYSSRKLKIAEGSIPMSGVSLLTRDLKAKIFSSAHFFAWVSIHFESDARALSVC